MTKRIDDQRAFVQRGGVGPVSEVFVQVGQVEQGGHVPRIERD
jgi:hypothetical protein